METPSKEEQRVFIKFCVNLGKTPKEIKQLLEQANNGRTVSRPLVFRWHKEFRDGRGSTKDKERSGRPSVIDNKLTLARNALQCDRRITVREVAEACDVGTATAHKMLTETLATSRVSGRCVPKLLTADQEENRVKASRQFLRSYQREGDAFLERIITTDEFWFYYYDPETKSQSSIWKHTSSPPPKKARVTTSVRKHMFILFMDRKWMLLTHAVPKGETVNADYYCRVSNYVNFI